MSTDLLQIIREDGKLGGKKPSKLSKTLLLELYRVMVTTRMLDERCMKLQRSGRIGFYVPSSGQEAASIGSAAALGPDDWVFPSYRSPGIPILRGVPIVEMLHNCYGNAADNAQGRQMPVHYTFRDANFVSISSPIGTQIMQAAGAAMASSIRGDKAVVMTYFGDGATSSNDFHTGLNFAGVFKAPVVFLCENNQWAISCDYTGQTASDTIAQKGEAYGMEGVLVDGNDVVAVYTAARRAVEKARKGGGPTLIEALTYRMGPHSSSDDPSRYRPDDLTAEWARKDPIKRFHTWLTAEKYLTPKIEEEVEAGAKDEIDAAIKTAQATAQPGVGSMFSDVYAEIPAELGRQHDALVAMESENASEVDPDAAFPL